MALQYLKLPIEGGKFYHIYKQSSISGPVFYSPGNYQFFMRKFDTILGYMVDLLSFSLMPDHFHLLFRAKEVILIKEEYVEHPVEIGHFISESLRKLFAVYSANITKQEGIVEPVLDNNFSRIAISDEEIIKALIKYIHYNPQFHGTTDNIYTYPHSSYALLAGKSKTLVDRETVFSLFGDQTQFISDHQLIDKNHFPTDFLLETI